MRKTSKIKIIILLGVLLVGIIDQVIKNFLPESLIYKNSQAMFGYFNGNVAVKIIIPALIIAVICIFAIKSKVFWIKLSLFSILVGGTSNLIDRIMCNSVIDYLPFFGFSRFNIADLLIYVGVGTSIIYFISSTKFTNGKREIGIK
ncbi:hypothetical protein D4R87_02630 [bacterium]|nr:MAG: hypothetical protein D4R87_02630 [bacterium]